MTAVTPQNGVLILDGQDGPKLGCLPAKSDPRALMFARFSTEPRTIPKATKFWVKRHPFPLRTYGNTQYGDCTRAKQAHASMRMERLESGRMGTVEDAEVVRVYLAMTQRLYGGGDTGAFETDALSEWRKPEFTFKNDVGHTLTIDAFLRVNQADQQEVRSAMYLAAAHGLAICLSLPLGFQGIAPPADWDVPVGQALIGPWLPGSWGGHSLWTRDYDEIGVWLVHSWGIPDQRITWAAFAAYCSEAHICLDSLDYWRTKKPAAAKALDLKGIKRAVNKVSSQKIT